MKVKSVQYKEDASSIFVVTLTPNWIEKLFGVKEKQEEYKAKGYTFMCGGGEVYFNKKFDDLPNGHKIGVAIDKFRMKW